jgi:hypothetical protein
VAPLGLGRVLVRDLVMTVDRGRSLVATVELGRSLVATVKLGRSLFLGRCVVPVDLACPLHGRLVTTLGL